ncbi:MAG TPA: GNAT family N-acetyltransferase [Solirubrobacteraceae bacterium]
MSRIVLPAEPLLDAATALRPWRDSDTKELIRICQDPEIVRWTNVPPGYGEADARIYLLRRHDAVLAGSAAPFAITTSEELIGSISLIRIEWEQRRAEVGYFLAADARGAGHATRAVGLISGWAFSALGLERIDLYAATDNVASQRVAERSGFEREALLRSFLRGKGAQLDMVAFGLLSTG